MTKLRDLIKLPSYSIGPNAWKPGAVFHIGGPRNDRGRPGFTKAGTVWIWKRGDSEWYVLRARPQYEQHTVLALAYSRALAKEIKRWLTSK